MYIAVVCLLFGFVSIHDRPTTGLEVQNEKFSTKICVLQWNATVNHCRSPSSILRTNLIECLSCDLPTGILKNDEIIQSLERFSQWILFLSRVSLVFVADRWELTTRTVINSFSCILYGTHYNKWHSFYSY